MPFRKGIKRDVEKGMVNSEDLFPPEISVP